MTFTHAQFYLKRDITSLQFVGALCIVFSIVVAKFGKHFFLTLSKDIKRKSGIQHQPSLLLSAFISRLVCYRSQWREKLLPHLRENAIVNCWGCTVHFSSMKVWRATGGTWLLFNILFFMFLSFACVLPASCVNSSSTPGYSVHRQGFPFNRWRHGRCY